MMPLDTEVDLSPGHIVLDGNPPVKQLNMGPTSATWYLPGARGLPFPI